MGKGSAVCAARRLKPAQALSTSRMLTPASTSFLREIFPSIPTTPFIRTRLAGVSTLPVYSGSLTVNTFKRVLFNGRLVLGEGVNLISRTRSWVARSMRTSP